MTTLAKPWDYLIVTASNDRQAAAYETQLGLRLRLGMLSDVGQVVVVPDPRGRRVGSGGSTVFCLLEVLRRELGLAGSDDPAVWREVLGRLRILIVHAGGDSKRLPAYGPCGKIFIPIPGPNESGIPRTLFDRQLPTYLDLPAMPDGAGQVVVAAGDDIKLFDAQAVQWAPRGLTALGCYATPETASRHGVFVPAPDGTVRHFFQKASVETQRQLGAVDRYGRSVLDVAVGSFDADAAVAMLRMCDVTRGPGGTLTWSGPMGTGILEHGLDFFSDICCALGTEATCEGYLAAVRAVGGTWSDSQLRKMFELLSPIPLAVRALAECDFLHFGTTIQLISSGLDLFRRDGGIAELDKPLDVNNEVVGPASLIGSPAWVEACRLAGSVRLEGENILTGLDTAAAVSLPRGMCVDVLQGTTRKGSPGWFVRVYGSRDTFKDSVAAGATFCNMPVDQWLTQAGALPGDVWPQGLPGAKQTLWTAKIIPAADAADAFADWLWMFDPASADDSRKQAWRAADRYSLEEIALLADQDAFHARRMQIVADDRARGLVGLFRPHSQFTAHDLAHVLGQTTDRADIVARLVRELHRHDALHRSAESGDFSYSRILHSLGSAAGELAGRGKAALGKLIPGLDAALAEVRDLGEFHLTRDGLWPREKTSAAKWAKEATAAALLYAATACPATGDVRETCPTNALREHQVAWGRAPVCLALGGDWTDTPPCALEFDGAVLHAAVDLNGRPPVQAFLRVIDEPVIRLGSIDAPARKEIRDLDGLLDFGRPGNEFARAQAALALAGFAPRAAPWPGGITLKKMLQHFGGGIELTTFAGVPKASGLGPGRILGAVILAVIHRAMGQELSRAELFRKALQLEQSLASGGGWQDPIGGIVDGVKLTRTPPGPLPRPDVHSVPPDVLDPRRNGGATLLYYTGLTQPAESTREQFVGRYLDRDRRTMQALDQERFLAGQLAEAMGRRDAEHFGELVDVAGRLQRKFHATADPQPIRDLLHRIRPNVHGARFQAAAGGGFLLMVCPSPGHAAAVREDLQASPPNDQARFFDYTVSTEGLAVTVM